MDAKHAAQWGSAQHLRYPKLGALDVKVVDTTAVLDVLRPIWATKARPAEPVLPALSAASAPVALGAARLGTGRRRVGGSNNTWTRSSGKE